MNLKIILLYLVLILATNFCYAQQKQLKAKSERIAYIVKGLSIGNQKAEQVIAALDFNEQKMQQIMKDTLIRSIDKQQLMSSLLTEKRAKINILLTEDEQVKLKTLFQGQREKSMQFIKAARQKHDEESDRPLKGATLQKREIQNN